MMNRGSEPRLIAPLPMTLLISAASSVGVVISWAFLPNVHTGSSSRDPCEGRACPTWSALPACRSTDKWLVWSLWVLSFQFPSVSSGSLIVLSPSHDLQVSRVDAEPSTASVIKLHPWWDRPTDLLPHPTVSRDARHLVTSGEPAIAILVDCPSPQDASIHTELELLDADPSSVPVSTGMAPCGPMVYVLATINARHSNSPHALCSSATRATSFPARFLTSA